jgi:hypothetical protein
MACCRLAPKDAEVAEALAPPAGEAPWQRLNFFPLPQLQSSLRPTKAVMIFQGIGAKNWGEWEL